MKNYFNGIYNYLIANNFKQVYKVNLIDLEEVYSSLEELEIKSNNYSITIINRGVENEIQTIEFYIVSPQYQVCEKVSLDLFNLFNNFESKFKHLRKLGVYNTKVINNGIETNIFRIWDENIQPTYKLKNEKYYVFFYQINLK